MEMFINICSCCFREQFDDRRGHGSRGGRGSGRGRRWNTDRHGICLFAFCFCFFLNHCDKTVLCQVNTSSLSILVMNVSWHESLHYQQNTSGELDVISLSLVTVQKRWISASVVESKLSTLAYLTYQFEPYLLKWQLLISCFPSRGDLLMEKSYHGCLTHISQFYSTSLSLPI